MGFAGDSAAEPPPPFEGIITSSSSWLWLRRSADDPSGYAGLCRPPHRPRATCFPAFQHRQRLCEQSLAPVGEGVRGAAKRAKKGGSVSPQSITHRATSFVCSSLNRHHLTRARAPQPRQGGGGDSGRRQW